MQNQLLEPVFKNSFPGNFRYFPGVKFLFIKVGSIYVFTKTSFTAGRLYRYFLKQSEQKLAHYFCVQL